MDRKIDIFYHLFYSEDDDVIVLGKLDVDG